MLLFLQLIANNSSAESAGPTDRPLARRADETGPPMDVAASQRAGPGHVSYPSRGHDDSARHSARAAIVPRNLRTDMCTDMCAEMDLDKHMARGLPECVQACAHTFV